MEPSKKGKRNLDPGKPGVILDAAIRVFAEKGFHRATIRDVAQAAGVADGTIYNHFHNKTALLLAIFERLNQTGEREAQFRQAQPEDLGSFMRAYFRQRLETVTPEAQAVLQVLLSELPVNPELRERYRQEVAQPTFAVAEQAFSRWQAGGHLQTADLPLAVRAVAAMFLGTIMLRIIGDPVLEERWDELPEVLSQLTLHGLEGKEP